jgi:hypothetical protein
MTRKPDLAWEALVEVTNANEAIERGRLNTALKAIRSAWATEGGLPEDLAEEIPRRAKAYREMWPSMSLTPTALAVHWKRVVAQSDVISKGSKGLIDEMRKDNKE